MKDIAKVLRYQLRNLKNKRKYILNSINNKVIEKDVIDVYITSYGRPSGIDKLLASLFEAGEFSMFELRITLIVDAVINSYVSVINKYLTRINLITTHEQLGLPFSFNLILNHNRLMIDRTGKKCKYICYLQDDCIIQDEENFFTILDTIYEHESKEQKIGYIAGFYTPIHPGFKKGNVAGHDIVYSDSIDGKHIMGPPDVFQKVGEMTRFLPDGHIRGNPGPNRGSHFDLWQWRESPQSTMKQKRVNLIVPSLIEVDKTLKSTWGNQSDEDEMIQKRVSQGKVYKTR